MGWRFLKKGATHPTDAGMAGWQWRFVYGVGAGMLMAHRIIDDPTDINYTTEIVMTLIGVSLLIIGEVCILRAQDEFFRRVEERGMALGGITATASTLLFVFLARLTMDPTEVMNIAMAILIVGYVGTRTVYATYIHEKNKDLD